MGSRKQRRLGIATAVGACVVVGAFGAPTATSAPLLPPTAVLDVDPNPAVVGQTVVFDGSGSSGDALGSTIAKYEWDLDGVAGYEVETGPTTPTTARSYPAPGTINVSLRVTDSDGDIDEDTVSLRIHRAPVAGFIFEPSTPGVGEQMTFSSTSSDPDGPLPAGAEKWDFDNDGQFDDATGASVTHSFGSAGTKPVALEVTDSDGAKTVASRDVDVQTGNRAPNASFTFSPRNPHTGERVELVSTSTDPDGPIVDHAWDLDGDGAFDDATGPTAQRTFESPGTVTVGVRVRDAHGVSSQATLPVEVVNPPLELMSPFPVVRLAGEVRPSGKTLIEKLSVRAPKGSNVTVRCLNKSCSFRERHRTIWFGRIRFHGFNKALNPGTKIKIFVTEPAKIGKYTSFKLRADKAPKRRDKCLEGELTEPVRCL